jgi:hypothetical protein
MKPIVTVFDEIVKRVEGRLILPFQKLDSNITGIHFEHGHPLEIIETLKQKDKSQSYRFQKYPLVALFQDFPENNVGAGFESEVNLHLIIAKGTKNTYKAKERYEHNFTPFLYPVYNALFEEINRDRNFLTYGAKSIPHQKWDRLYWGHSGLFGNKSNIFNDYLDVIEIKNLKLKHNLSC